jgi:hypothetical protein
MSTHSPKPVMGVVIALAGELAVVILLSNVIPSAALWIFLFYGFWVPAWFFWSRIISHAPGVSDTGKPWILIPVFLPVWAASVAILWIPIQTLTQEMARGIVLAAVLCSTAFLLWRTPAIPTIPVRRIWNSSWRIAVWIGGGVLLGLILGSPDLFSGRNLAVFPQPTGRYSSLYFLPDQEDAFWNPVDPLITQAPQIYLNLEIVNHEGIASEYILVATQGEERAIGKTDPIALADGDSWTGYLQLDYQPGGDPTIYIFLERVGFPWPYRQLVIHMGNS